MRRVLFFSLVLFQCFFSVASYAKTSGGSSKGAGHSTPPQLMTAFIKVKCALTECYVKATEAVEKMNLKIPEDAENGESDAVIAYGEQSVVVMECQKFSNDSYVHIAVASHTKKAVEVIMEYLTKYFKAISASETPAPAAK
ncbi:exported hypothetical protein [Gammaproteobacteria bacterium]